MQIPRTTHTAVSKTTRKVLLFLCMVFLLTSCIKTTEGQVIDAIRSYVSDSTHHLAFNADDGDTRRIYSENLTIKSLTDSTAYVEFFNGHFDIFGAPDRYLEVGGRIKTTWACFRVSFKDNRWQILDNEVYTNLLGYGECSPADYTPEP